MQRTIKFFAILMVFVCVCHAEVRKQVCRDGKLPLLEGAGDGEPFPCIDECPDGFDCEHSNPVHPIGICCPNLDLLYELYGSSAEVTTPQTNEEVESSGEEIDETSTAELPLPTTTATSAVVTEIEFKPTENVDKKFLRLVNEREVRLSPVVKAAKNVEFKWANKWEDVKSYEDHPKFLTAVKTASNNFTCNRQKFETKCNAGVKKTQVVIRWYYKNDECVAYPFGFCPGNTVKDDKTMRTREECEAYCIRRETNPTFAVPSSTSTAFPTLVDSTISVPEGPVDGDVSTSNPVELVEVFPPGYGPEVDEDNKTRIILHSDVIDPIAVLPPNTASNAVARALGSVSKSANNKDQIGEHVMRGTLQLLKDPLESRIISSEQNDTVRPKKTCQKLTPYRSMCPRSGVPTQFTLRWHAKAGSCAPYPYGYCHGELVSDEEVISTKEECESLCLGNIASEAPFHLSRRHHQQ